MEAVIPMSAVVNGMNPMDELKSEVAHKKG